MLVAIFVLPWLFALAALAHPSERGRPWLLPTAASLHFGLVATVLMRDHVESGTEWLALDDLGRLVLGLLSTLFFACAVYAPGYLRARPERTNRIFVACLLFGLGMMSLVTLARHMGLMWVALEANTLGLAPLLYFNRNIRSIEATWKYLLVGGVGIAVALLGSFFLAYAAFTNGLHSSLMFDDLVAAAPRMSRPWLHASFILLFVGYGTKMGLAPLHSWKPDAYGEAPGLVGALFAGGMTSCAFLAVLRFFPIHVAGGEGEFARNVMMVVGLFSMAVGGVFMMRQKDLKRLLAYSSVEHMGILVLGVGLGRGALFGALLHLVNNVLSKGVMFLCAGNVHRAYGSKLSDDVQGALRRLPVSGPLLLAGFLAITGSPPFGPFHSELTIIRSAFSTGQGWAGAAMLILLFLVFAGQAGTVLRMVHGEPPARSHVTGFKDSVLTVLPPLVLMAGVLVLGATVPAPLQELLERVASQLEVAP